MLPDVDERLARAHRQQEIALRAQTLHDSLLLWPLLNPEKMSDTYRGWSAAQATLVARDHARSAALASRYLRAARLASGVSGDAVIQVASELPASQVEASLSVTARAGYYTALRSGRTAEQAREIALVRTLGATGRLVLNGGRDTTLGSIRADRKGRGWRRITGAKSCDFCQMLAGRGAVYSADTVAFAAHDHCACSAAVVYSDRSISVQAYAPSIRGRYSDRATSADRERMKSALAGI